MKKLFYLLSSVFFCLLVVSCTAKNKLLQPGDKIGEMTLVQEASATPYDVIYTFCDFGPDSHEPLKYSTTCGVPMQPGLGLRIGWTAKESLIASNWEAIEWGLKVDGQIVDLQAFKWEEFSSTNNGENLKSRVWFIALEDLTPGKHTLTWTNTKKTAIDDGFNIYQPGAYERTINFNILEKEE